MICALVVFFFFFFNDTATTEIYTLSLHDALPISGYTGTGAVRRCAMRASAASRYSRRRSVLGLGRSAAPRDRKSTRLNSSHLVISYAVFCLKKKKRKKHPISRVRCDHDRITVCSV